MGDRGRADLWASLFEDLAERGLNLETVELGIMDGLPGLEAIFQRFFARAWTQRCQKHAKANACRRVRKTRTRSLLQGSQDLNAIFYAPTQNAARGCLFRAEAAMGPAVSLGRTDHRERSGFLAEEGAAAPAAA